MKNCGFPGCDYKHKYSYAIQKHEKMHNSDPKVRRPHQCDYCAYRASTKYKLQDHVLIHFDRNKYSCSVPGCEFKTHNKRCLYNHEKHAHLTTKMSCPFEGCGYKCKVKRYFEMHVEKHHSIGAPEKKVECPMCPEKFLLPEFMRDHLKRHTKEKPWRCSLCNFETLRKPALHRHLDSIHGDLRLSSREHLVRQCELCGFTTSFGCELRRHLVSHSDERPFPCTLPGCSYRAKRNDALKRHEKSIHNYERLPCPQPGCTSVVKTKELLAAHHRMVHQSTFACAFPGCRKNFKNEARLVGHQKMHDPNREFACKLCQNRFDTTIKLADHTKRVHSEVKGFRCSHCDYCTNYRQYLSNHLKNIHRANSILCSESGCNYRNYNPLLMTEHVKKVHDESLLFKCEFCSYRFARKPYLHKHHVKVHFDRYNKSSRFLASNNNSAPSPLQCVCRTCGTIFRDNLSLAKHGVRHRTVVVTLSRIAIQFP